jgi:hypothetical protein
MVQTELTLDYPLVDENFNTLEAAHDFIEKTNDEFQRYLVNVIVSNLTMVPTAMFFSLRKRNNIKFRITLGDFKGANFIHSFLISGHIFEVINEQA